MAQTSQTTHFGERTVALEDKQGLVNAVFHGVADRYDLMNDLMSGGIHRVWKDAMVADLAPPKSGSRPYRVLDMAGGTGDIAERIINASVGYAEVVVSDINSDMLRVGAERAKSWRYPAQASFVEANAEAQGQRQIARHDDRQRTFARQHISGPDQPEIGGNQHSGPRSASRSTARRYCR